MENIFQKLFKYYFKLGFSVFYIEVGYCRKQGKLLDKTELTLYFLHDDQISSKEKNLVH